MVARTDAFTPLARSPGSPGNRKSDIKQPAGQMSRTENLQVIPSTSPKIGLRADRYDKSHQDQSPLM